MENGIVGKNLSKEHISPSTSIARPSQMTEGYQGSDQQSDQDSGHRTFRTTEVGKGGSLGTGGSSQKVLPSNESLYPDRAGLGLERDQGIAEYVRARPVTLRLSTTQKISGDSLASEVLVCHKSHYSVGGNLSSMGVVRVEHGSTAKVGGKARFDSLRPRCPSLGK